MMKKYLTVLILSLMVTSTALAQPPGDDFDRDFDSRPFMQPPDMDHGPGAGMSPRQMKRLEAFQLMKMMEFLQVDEETEVILTEAFRNHKKEQEELWQRRQNVIDELAADLRSGQASNDKIISLMASLDAYDDSLHFQRKQFINIASEYLSPEQMGKLYLFQSRFARQVLGKMREFRQGPPPPGDDRRGMRQQFKDNKPDGK